MTIHNGRSALRPSALLGLAAVPVMVGCHRVAPAAATPARAEPAEPECVSLLGGPLYANPPGDTVELELKLRQARAAYEADPDDPDKLIWVGRRLGYLWRMNEAIAVYTEGIRRFPDYAPLYRHRGHRYISVRKFAQAERDLEKAAELIEGKPDVIEEDGMPNERNIPLTTLGFNVWYHLGLARFLQLDHEGARGAYRKAMKHTRGYDDNVVAVTYWTCLSSPRGEREGLLEPIRQDMSILENSAYHRLLLLFKGELGPDEVLAWENAGALDVATLGYGVARWHVLSAPLGPEPKAERAYKRMLRVMERVLETPYWPAFGFIAAEAHLGPFTRDYERLRRATPVEPMRGGATE